MRNVFSYICIIFILSYAMISFANSVYTPGDLNKDGHILISDAKIVLELLTGQAVSKVDVVYDINNDKIINLPEAIFDIQINANIRTAPEPINQYTITASSGDNGSISPFETIKIDHGVAQTFTITPVKGYHVADVLVNSQSVGAVTTYTFSNVIADMTIHATFIADGIKWGNNFWVEGEDEYSIGICAGQNSILFKMNTAKNSFGEKDLLVSKINYTNGTINWSYIFGTTKNDKFWIHLNSDSNFTIYGLTETNENDVYHPAWALYDNSLNTLYSKKLSISASSFYASPNKYIFTGNTDLHTDPSGNSCPFFIVINDSGEIIKGLKFINDNSILYSSIFYHHKISRLTILNRIDGSGGNINNAGNDFKLALLDSNGNTIWVKRYEFFDPNINSKCEGVLAVNNNNNNSILIHGEVKENYSTVGYWIAKIDLTGNVQWCKSYSTIKNISSISQDNDYYFCSSSIPNKENSFLSDLLLFSLNTSTGECINASRYYTGENLWGYITTSDSSGQNFFLGSSSSQGYSDRDALYGAISNDLNFSWSKKFDYSDIDSSEIMALTDSNQFFVQNNIKSSQDTRKVLGVMLPVGDIDDYCYVEPIILQTESVDISSQDLSLNSTNTTLESQDLGEATDIDIYKKVATIETETICSGSNSNKAMP